MGIAMRTGHYRFPDGSVLRVDLEMGRWIGTLYAPTMTIKRQSSVVILRFTPGPPASRHNTPSAPERGRAVGAGGVVGANTNGLLSGYRWKR